MFSNLFSAAAKVVSLPVAAAVDVVTLGGILIDCDRPKSAIAETIKSAARDVQKIND